jgi:hypothetical protein
MDGIAMSQAERDELHWLNDGELKARYQGNYVELIECGSRVTEAKPTVSKPVRKDHNAGGRSQWMQGFFDRPSPPLWKSIGD